MKMKTYDARALKEIHAWKNPKLGLFGRAIRVINWPMNKAGDLLLVTPGLSDVIRHSIQGLIGVCNDVAQWTIQKEAIYIKFRKAGYTGIKKGTDVFGIDLEDVDKIVGWLDSKYKWTALAEGAGTGAVGATGIPLDLVALILLNLRAIGEYATYMDLMFIHRRRGCLP